MAAKKLQTVAEAFEAWNRDDFAAAVEHFTEDVEWHPHIGDTETRRGRKELERLFRETAEDAKLRLNFSHMEAVGERILVDVFATPVEGGGADEPDAGWFQLYSFRDGAICVVESFGKREDAVEAAGGGPR